jgi:plasmid stability protein
MSAITIRKLPDSAKRRLRLRAAARGTSMEAEARAILLAALDAPNSADISWIEQLVELGREAGGVELHALPDEPASYARFDA